MLGTINALIEYSFSIFCIQNSMTATCFLSRKIIQLLQTTFDPESENYHANKEERYNFGEIRENAGMHKLIILKWPAFLYEM